MKLPTHFKRKPSSATLVCVGHQYARKYTYVYHVIDTETYINCTYNMQLAKLVRQFLNTEWYDSYE